MTAHRYRAEILPRMW